MCGCLCSNATSARARTRSLASPHQRDDGVQGVLCERERECSFPNHCNANVNIFPLQKGSSVKASLECRKAQKCFHEHVPFGSRISYRFQQIWRIGLVDFEKHAHTPCISECCSARGTNPALAAAPVDTQFACCCDCSELADGLHHDQ